jgi:integrase
MLWLGVLIGLRWGEVAGLRVADLDLLRNEVAIAKQLTRERVLGEPKSEAGRRVLAMPAALVEMLSRHLAARELTAADDDAFLFVTSRGTPLDYAHWRLRVWVPACERAGLVGLGFHDLRRANATGMVADNVDLKTAQTRLGHSDPRLTLALYAQATSPGDRAAADALAERFFSGHAANARRKRPLT